MFHLTFFFMGLPREGDKGWRPLALERVRLKLYGRRTRALVIQSLQNAAEASQHHKETRHQHDTALKSFQRAGHWRLGILALPFHRLQCSQRSKKCLSDCCRQCCSSCSLRAILQRTWPRQAAARNGGSAMSLFTAQKATFCFRGAKGYLKASFK